MQNKTQERLHRDPITDEPSCHPVGTGVGAATGGTAGAALGAMGGPIGAVFGAAVGAVVGGMAGKDVAEAIDPTAEDAYWRTNYWKEPYVDRTMEYEDYAPAFRMGYDRFAQGERSEFTHDGLEDEWHRLKGKSRLTWQKAKHAVRAGWQRMHRAFSDAPRRGVD